MSRDNWPTICAFLYEDINFPIDQESLKSAKYEFEQNIRTNRIHIIDSNGVRHKVLASIDNTDNNGQRNENTGPSSQMSYLVLGLAVGAVVVMIALIIITACAVRSYMYRKFLRQIRPRTASVIAGFPSFPLIHTICVIPFIDGNHEWHVFRRWHTIGKWLTNDDWHQQRRCQQFRSLFL